MKNTKDKDTNPNPGQDFVPVDEVQAQTSSNQPLNNPVHDRAIRNNNAHNLGRTAGEIGQDEDEDYSNAELNLDEEDMNNLPRVIPNHTGEVFNEVEVRGAYHGEKVMSPHAGHVVPGVRFALEGERVVGPKRNKGSRIVGDAEILATGTDPITNAPLVGDENSKDEDIGRVEGLHGSETGASV